MRLQQDLELKRREEELELSKQFKANTLPMTTMLPLYEALCKQYVARTVQQQMSLFVGCDTATNVAQCS